MCILDRDVKGMVIGKPIRQKRIGAGIPASSALRGNADTLLPNRTRVGNFNNLGLRIKVAPEIREINMCSDVIAPEILNWIETGEINFLGNGLARLDVERVHFLRRIGCDRLAIAADDFESEPAITRVVV